jgi:hypothetical protein
MLRGSGLAAVGAGLPRLLPLDPLSPHSSPRSPPTSRQAASLKGLVAPLTVAATARKVQVGMSRPWGV